MAEACWDLRFRDVVKPVRRHRRRILSSLRLLPNDPLHFARPPREASTLHVNWYCIHTHPQKEGPIARHLSGKLGLEVYLPRLRLRKTIRRVRRVVIRPLFPRYLFCRFDLSSHYRAVRFAPEVSNIVHLGANPAIVQPALIQQLKEWAGDQVDIVTLGLELRPGQTVEVTDGPMRGLQAIVSHAMSDRERVTVLLSILETQVNMVISRDQLSPVEPDRPLVREAVKIVGPKP